ncbi:MAG TPA: OPT/YSL family transporter [Planctomycetota bacterium]|nr:OPT/YSL family transporter [Planctomycetota bacterium]
MNPNRPYRELTPASMIGGILVGALLNMGIVFAGLQIGFTIVGSAVGAILGFGLLRGVLRKGSILEVNIFQTIASSVNTVNAGVIFTVPVLFLLGFRKEGVEFALQDGQWMALGLACMAGSLLGVVMIIPLRRQIIDYERLRFPSAVAVAAILKSPGAGIQKSVMLLIGIAISATITFATLDWGVDWTQGWTGNIGWLQGLMAWGDTGGHSILPDSINLGRELGAWSGLRLVFAVTTLSLGAGFLAGRPGLAVLYGTLLNFWLLIPCCVFLGWVPPNFAGFDFFQTTPEAYTKANQLAGAFRDFTANKVGIGMILGGAIAGLLVAYPALKAAFASLRGSKDASGRQEEVSFGVIRMGLIFGSLMLLGAAKLSGGEWISWGTALLVTAAGLAWLWLAGLVVAQTTGRTDWSPLSGLALIAIAILMGILGARSQESILPAVTIGAAICVATSMCADMMADLKTGYLVGGRPLKQQVAQIATCWIGPGISLLTVWLLWTSFAFGSDQAQILYARAVAEGPQAVQVLEEAGGSPTQLAKGVPQLGAPQAAALEKAINIVQSGDLPLGKYLTGFALGLAVSILVSPGMGVMVGLSLYLPFMYMIVFGIGGLLSIFLTKVFGARAVESKGVPLAAGLIVGEALVGIINALIKVQNSL